jgi:hypothetical protein
MHEQAEAALEELLREDPHDYVSAEALATLRFNGAYELAAAGNSAAALADLDKNFALLKPMLEQEPNLVGIRDKLCRTFGVRGEILEFFHRIPEAVAAREQVVALATPENKDEQRIALARLRCKSGDRTRAIADADDIAVAIRDSSVTGPPAQSWRKAWSLAQVYSNALPLVDKEKDLTTEQRDALRKRYVAAAISLLDQARTAAGPAEWNKEMPEAALIKTFKPLRRREEFRRWVKSKPEK